MPTTPRIDLDDDALDLGGLPRFRRAAFYASRLRLLSLSIGGCALLLLLAAHWVASPLLRIALINNGAAWLLLAAGLQSAYWIAGWRVHAASRSAAAIPAATQAGAADTVPRRLLRLRIRVLKVADAIIQGMRSSAGQVAWLIALSAIAVAAIAGAWGVKSLAPLSSVAAEIAGGCALVAAFGMLVLERYLAAAAPLEWPEQAQVTQLARVALTVLLASALCLFLSTGERLWPMRILLFVGALPFAVALELLLRALLSPFSPDNERMEPSLLAESMLAGLIRWPPRPWQTLQDELQQRFGIDLRQNWAVAFMRRALLPVLASLAMLGWLLTGVSEIPLAGRGIYERFGKPVAVWQPGLHLSLPWPFGRVRGVENGVVHELATASAAELDSKISGDSQATATELSDAEGPAPDSANRLWDVSHTAEKSQVIASLANQRQSFHIVNMDVRFVYCIGGSDQAALAATYNSTDIEALIRSTASQILVNKFAARTLDSVLGEQRTALGSEIALAVQAQLDALNSGVQILAAIVEAIHPPAGAANAYHSVQAAQITAQALIARERGNAAEQLNLAQLKASIARDKATAGARETKANADAANLRYVAERDAYRTAGKAFLLEHYLSQLTQGLNGSALVVVDHRIGGGSAAPTIDLRTYTTPIDSSLARRSEP